MEVGHSIEVQLLPQLAIEAHHTPRAFVAPGLQVDPTKSHIVGHLQEQRTHTFATEHGKPMLGILTGHRPKDRYRHGYIAKSGETGDEEVHKLLI